MSAYAYGLKQVVQVVTVVTRLFSLANFCHHLVTAVSIFLCGHDLAHGRHRIYSDPSLDSSRLKWIELRFPDVMVDL